MCIASLEFHYVGGGSQPTSVNFIMSYTNTIYNETKYPTYEWYIPQWSQNRHTWIKDYLTRKPGVERIDECHYRLPYDVVFEFFSDLALSATRILEEYQELSDECEEEPDTPAHYMLRRIARKASQNDEIVMEVFAQEDRPYNWLRDLDAVLSESDKNDKFIYSVG